MERIAQKITIKNKLENEQLFKISRFKEVMKRTKPHKHDGYFELIYLSEGAGFHWIDAEKFQITTTFLQGMQTLTTSCNACHAKEKVPFFTVNLPVARQSPIRK